MLNLVSKKSNDERALIELQSRLATLQKDLVAAEADEKVAEDKQRSVYRTSQDPDAFANVDNVLLHAQARIKGLASAIIEIKNEVAELERRVADAKAAAERKQAADKRHAEVEAYRFALTALEKAVSDA